MYEINATLYYALKLITAEECLINENSCQAAMKARYWEGLVQFFMWSIG